MTFSVLLDGGVLGDGDAVAEDLVGRELNLLLLLFVPVPNDHAVHELSDLLDP